MLIAVLVVLSSLLLGCSTEDTAPACPESAETTWHGVDFPYDVSANESLVVFTRLEPSGVGAGAYVVPVSGNAVPTFLLPVDIVAADPNGFRFSPDGKELVMVRRGYDDLYVLDIATGAERQITFTEGNNALAPDWDPGGRYIVYTRPDLHPGAPDSSSGIHIVDLDTLTDRVLRAGGEVVYGGNPRWSPDGRSILFSYGVRMGSRTPLHIFRVDLDGAGYQDLTPTEVRNNDYPQWIEGGERIIYESYDESTFSRHETRVMKADGSDASRWPIDLRGGPSALSRDGKFLVVVDADSSGNYGVLHVQSSTDQCGVSRRQIVPDYSPASSIQGMAVGRTGASAQ
jgi:dipeptidyl aminopeptidase/acylaminoacyl peptidase